MTSPETRRETCRTCRKTCRTCRGKSATCRDQNGKSHLPQPGAASLRQVSDRSRKALRAMAWRPAGLAATPAGKSCRAVKTDAKADLPPPLYIEAASRRQVDLGGDHDF
jgi:hypothetical protein